MLIHHFNNQSREVKGVSIKIAFPVVSFLFIVLYWPTFEIALQA